MLKRALFAGAIVAAFGCRGHGARDAAVAGVGAGAPPPVASAPVAPAPVAQTSTTQTIEGTGMTNLNTGTDVPWEARRTTPEQARRTPTARRSTTPRRWR